MNKGIDSFFEAPGAVNRHTCLACGALCRVNRDQIGPTGWAGALIGAQTPHDHFFCPNSGQDWHDQAVRLFQQYQNAASPRVAELIEQDLFDLLNQHGCIPE